MVNDIVGTVHLITVNARFVRDPVWSLGILTTLELLLKNYPEPGMYERITSSLFKACNLDEAAIRAEAASLTEWAQGKTKEDVEAALKNADESILGVAAKGIKEDEFWMYSKFFGKRFESWVLDLVEWFGALKTIYGHLQNDLLLTRSF